MNNYSKTYAGAIAMMLVYIAQSLQVDLPLVEAESIVYGLVALASFILTLYGRFVADEPVTLYGRK